MLVLPTIPLSFVLWWCALSTGERWAFGSAFVVLIGVVGESIADLTDWIKDDKVSKWVEKVSALVLILGLTGDLIAIGITQREIAEITREASDAKTSAQGAADAAKLASDISGKAQQKADAASRTAREANDASGRAKTTASDALSLSSDARKDVGQLRTDMADAAKEARELQDESRSTMRGRFQATGDRTLDPFCISRSTERQTGRTRSRLVR